MSVSILGAGISGLSVCHFLKKSPKLSNVRLTLFERSNRPGGWIETDNRDEFYFELGPRSIRTASGNRIFDIIEGLDIEKELIFPSKSADTKLIYSNGKMNVVPNSLLGMIQSPLIRPHLLGAIKGITRKHELKQVEDVSIKDFYSQYLGPGLTNSLLAATYTGIYAGNIARLSIKSTNPLLYNITRKNGRLISSMFSLLDPKQEFPSKLKLKLQNNKVSFFTFKGGLNTLTHGIAKQYEDSIKFGTDISSIEFSKDNKIILKSNDIENENDYVVSTIPAYHLSKLMKPHNEYLSDLLDSIEYASIATVSFGFDTKVIPSDMEGFGFLIPPNEKSKILGATFDSVAFPNGKTETRITVMIGGDTSNHENVVDVNNTSKEDLEKIGLEALEKYLQIEQSPSVCIVKICQNSIPQYTLGHGNKIQQILDITQKEYPNLLLTGSYIKDVSISGCVDNSFAIASELIKKMQTQEV